MMLVFGPRSQSGRSQSGPVWGDGIKISVRKVKWTGFSEGETLEESRARAQKTLAFFVERSIGVISAYF
jgi:hypothetical protein